MRQRQETGDTRGWNRDTARQRRGKERKVDSRTSDKMTQREETVHDRTWDRDRKVRQRHTRRWDRNKARQRRGKERKVDIRT